MKCPVSGHFFVLIAVKSPLTGADPPKRKNKAKKQKNILGVAKMTLPLKTHFTYKVYKNKTAKEIVLMVVMSNISKENLKEIFLDICDELQIAIPEREQYFKNLQREITEYSNFDCFANLCDVVSSHYDVLERDTIVKVFRAMQSL